MKSILNSALAAAASISLLVTPTPAFCDNLSNFSVWGTFINGTRYDVTFSNVRWSGRYGTAQSDGTITNRIQGTVAPGKTVYSYHRMGDPEIGERYTELSFDAIFTRSDGTTGKCYFWYAYYSSSGKLTNSAASPGGDKPYPRCNIAFNSSADSVTFDMIGTEGDSPN